MSLFYNLLSAYYDLSQGAKQTPFGTVKSITTSLVSSVNDDPSLTQAEFDSIAAAGVATPAQVTKLANATFKSQLKRYYVNGSYTDAFAEVAEQHFPGVSDMPTTYLDFNGDSKTIYGGVQNLMGTLGLFFAHSNEARLNFINFTSTVRTMLSPVDGSPAGIQYVMGTVESVIQKLQSLIGATKVNKSGSELDNVSKPDGYNFSNLFDYVVSPSDSLIEEYFSFDHPDEIFQTTSNKDIYMDFLSVNETGQSTGVKFKTLRPDIYRKRCHLEAAKYTGLASTYEGFLNENIGAGYFNDVYSPSYLSDTGFSYLSPSIIEISDPTMQNKSYEYMYRAFGLGVSLYSDQIYNNPTYPLNLEELDRVYVAILNYSDSKSEYDDADLINPMLPVKEGDEIVSINTIEMRESYKKLFEDVGITVHVAETYSKFFEKLPGAISATPQPASDNDLEDLSKIFPLRFKDFSDGQMHSHVFLRDILLDSRQGFVKAVRGQAEFKAHDAVSVLPFDAKPNIFKVMSIQQGHDIGGTQSPLNPNLRHILKNSKPEPYGATTVDAFNAYFFLNMNLLSKIEVYRGRVDGRVLKYDEESWSLLTIEDLDGLGTTDNNLFCRIKFFSEHYARHIKVPILDKFFLIQNISVEMLEKEISDLQAAGLVNYVLGSGNNNTLESTGVDGEPEVIIPGGGSGNTATQDTGQMGGQGSSAAAAESASGTGGTASTGTNVGTMDTGAGGSGPSYS